MLNSSVCPSVCTYAPCVKWCILRITTDKETPCWKLSLLVSNKSGQNGNKANTDVAFESWWFANCYTPFTLFFYICYHAAPSIWPHRSTIGCGHIISSCDTFVFFTNRTNQCTSLFHRLDKLFLISKYDKQTDLIFHNQTLCNSDCQWDKRGGHCMTI